MADTTQDFNINIRTLADLTGIKLTQEGLVALQNAAKQGNIASIEALKQLSAAQKDAQAAQASASASGAGFTGTAVGVGTILTLLTHAVTAWKRFEDEQDKIIQKMEEAREKTYELGLSVADTLEEMKSAARIATEPLEGSFGRLTHDAGVLKSELQTAFETGAYEDAKKYVAQLRVVESQLDRVTSAIQRQAIEAARAAEKRQKDLQDARDASSSEVQGVLGLEQVGRAQAASNLEAVLSADDKKDLEEIRRLRREANPPTAIEPYRQPQPGEPGGGEIGPAAEAAPEAKREEPTPLTNPAPKEDMIAKPIEDKTIGSKSAEIITAIVNLEKTFLRFWGP